VTILKRVHAKPGVAVWRRMSDLANSASARTLRFEERKNGIQFFAKQNS
jgi:hypothetical protein